MCPLSGQRLVDKTQSQSNHKKNMIETIALHSPFLNEHNTILILVSYQNAFLLHFAAAVSLHYTSTQQITDQIATKKNCLASKELCGDTYSSRSKSFH